LTDSTSLTGTFTTQIFKGQKLIFPTHPFTLAGRNDTISGTYGPPKTTSNKESVFVGYIITAGGKQRYLQSYAEYDQALAASSDLEHVADYCNHIDDHFCPWNLDSEFTLLWQREGNRFYWNEKGYNDGVPAELPPHISSKLCKRLEDEAGGPFVLMHIYGDEEFCRLRLEQTAPPIVELDHDPSLDKLRDRYLPIFDPAYLEQLIPKSLLVRLGLLREMAPPAFFLRNDKHFDEDPGEPSTSFAHCHDDGITICYRRSNIKEASMWSIENSVRHELLHAFMFQHAIENEVSHGPIYRELAKYVGVRWYQGWE
jgi:hypothetical protein